MGLVLLRSVWLLAAMMGMSKLVAAVFCLAGTAAGAGCYCSCCNWIWCDNCQTGCCQGSMCSTPNCRNPGPAPTPTPPPPQPPAAGWQQLGGTGCCPDNKCGGNKLFFGQLQDHTLTGCENHCAFIGGVYANKWQNDPSYCACYSACDCSQGDSQSNCQRYQKMGGLALGNTTNIVAATPQQRLAITVSVI